jgi:hypothetical protein
MSFGYKLSYFAIGGVLIALSWANGCQAQSNSYPMTEQREDHAASTDGYASPNCESPKSAEEANFCEQRRSAAAAEQQAIWGREQALWARTQTWLSAGQVVLGIVGLVAVVVTLIYTARAAKAATEAAQSAAMSAAVAVNAERPYVFIEDIELKPIPLPHGKDRTDPGDLFSVTFIFKNYGRTPAFVRRIGWGFEVSDGKSLPTKPEYRLADNLTIEAVVQEGKTLKFPVPYNLLTIKPEQRALCTLGGGLFPYVWGHIRYADFMNGVAETGFVAFQYPEMRAGPHLIQTAAFRFRGPPAYTYHRYREDGSDPS